MERKILFDTETTGFDPDTGDRIIEIAALELIGDLPTGETFHVLINPERDIPAEATKVHGFTLADLEGKPKFSDVAKGFLDFIGDDPLVAHNAQFDFKFINAELKKAGFPEVGMERMIDTLEIARNTFPGMPNSLDALCRRYSVDLSERTTHNALLDCRLLAEVYIELLGGRQHGLGLAAETVTAQLVTYTGPASRTIRKVRPSEEEKALHKAFCDKIPGSLWESGKPPQA
ncbi:DNA polymerase III subunit epsilon [Acetobacter sp. AN02]|uniref:DNA polymerase III subunit epsilon n=1 Tax=Acetobacter sp. AN02 TaxID=2894186 RepID=UPI002434303E|nr:DNA polymerase III subunit epsilon [Acetobacter sp. AN02]MDG6093750.1 DNA polymerase III subunit epsilon [Acetobacter sp. AN02]